MRFTALILAFSLAATFVALAPTTQAANGCTVLRGPCPGLVCYGTGDHYGYLVCVGPGYCDPAACEPYVDLCDYMDNCVILP